MKKPEKKELLDGLPDHSLCNLEGYNQACDDFNAWLPSWREIHDLIYDCSKIDYEYDGARICDMEKAAKAIRKRLMDMEEL